MSLDKFSEVLLLSDKVVFKIAPSNSACSGHFYRSSNKGSGYVIYCKNENIGKAKARLIALERKGHEADIKIDLKDLDSEENLQAFFHALSTVVPCDIFNRIIGDNKNHIEFNHTANLLCFVFVDVKK